MSINDFYAMFVSTEESALFSALRQLSLLANPEDLVSADGPDNPDVWAQWLSASPADHLLAC